MKRFLLALAAAGALAGAASAADLPSKKGPIALPPPVFSWTGFYVGAYAGAILGEGNFTVFQSLPLRGAGFVGGGTIGYNWQWSPTVVLGAEADFGYRDAINSFAQGNLSTTQTAAGILGSFRGRAGYAFAPRWLAYATAGLAFGSSFNPGSFVQTAPFILGNDNAGTTVRPGWTAGGGIEYALTDQISLKGEYLYTWLADTGVAYGTNRGPATLNVGSAGHVVRGGVNWHFGAAAAAPALITK